MVDPGKEARAKAGIPVVPVFDGYRAFAILGVVVLHLLRASGMVGTGDDDLIARLTWGTVGHSIDVLFIVSGFVVFLPTVARAGRMGSVKAYAIRRISRLYPAYWLILTIILILIATTTVTDLAMPSFRDVLINYSGLHVPLGLPIPGISTGFGVNSATWTLSVEVCFYLVLPLIAGFWSRRPWLCLLGAAVVTVAWNEFFQHLGQINSDLGLGIDGGEVIRLAVSSTLQFPSWAFSFGVGMTAAWVFVNRDAIFARLGEGAVTALKVAGGVALVFFAWRASLHSDDGAFELVAEQTRFNPWIALGFSGSLAMVMAGVALRPGRFGRIFSNRPVRRLGDISYGIFLSHLVIMTFVGAALDLPQNGSLRDLALWAVIVIPASVLYGYLSARFLEQPIRRWARKYGRTASR